MDYDKIISNRKIFNEFVYTPLSEALRLLEERRKDPELMQKIEELLEGDIPKILVKKKCSVLNRQIATPNYETKRFLSLSIESNLIPIFFEYLNDKFTPENPFKHSIGHITLHGGIGKKGGEKNEYQTIIDFNSSNGKKIIDVKTIWNKPLVNLHKQLFSSNLNVPEESFIDFSNWFDRKGEKPKEYYKKFFLLFICHGILFENFMLNDEEKNFSKEVVLPAILEVVELLGTKPLIVPIEPIDIEDDKYWYYYDKNIKSILEKNNV